MMKTVSKINKKLAKELFIKYKLDPKVVPENEWHFALNVELEHGTILKKKVVNVSKNNIDITARIAIAHLLEHPRYYSFLKEMEKKMEKVSKTTRSIFL